jgi:hypothetical protein
MKGPPNGGSGRISPVVVTAAHRSLWVSALGEALRRVVGVGPTVWRRRPLRVEIRLVGVAVGCQALPSAVQASPSAARSLLVQWGSA